MGIFTGGEHQYKWAKITQQYSTNLQELQQAEEFNRNLLSDVRQARIAAAQIRQDNYSEEFTGSGAAGATANVYSSLAGSYGYGIDSSFRLKNISELNAAAAKLYERGQKRDKRAATNAQIATSGLQIGGAVIGGLLGGPAGAVAGSAIGGALGAGAVKAMGGGKAAVKAATGTAVKGTLQSAAFASMSQMISAAQGVGNAAEGAAASGGKLTGYTADGLPKFDLTGTAASGGNVSFTNMSTTIANGRRYVISDGFIGSVKLPGVY